MKYNKKVIDSYGRPILFNFCNIEHFFIILKNNNFYKRLDINERKKKRKIINKNNIYAINLIQKNKNNLKDFPLIIFQKFKKI